MTEIQAKIRFKEYEYRRGKNMGGNPVLYTKTHWIGEQVCLIPMPITMTDRMIEKTRDDDGNYCITVPVKEIINKKVTDGHSVGRVYAPKDWVGLDVLIVKTPQIDDLF